MNARNTIQASGSELIHGVAVEHRYVQLSDVTLHCVEAGSGPLVLMIHGFPDFWYSWRHLLPALSAAGFRAVALDLRGYNLSTKPRSLLAYRIDRLVADIAGVIRALGAERASVIGHDWGAGIAWAFAMHHPELLTSIAVLNGPHPQRLFRGFLRWEQLRKSWYVFVLQLPWLPERMLRRNGYAILISSLRDEAASAAFSSEDLARYVEAWAQPGALAAMLKYFRALFLPATAMRMRRIDAPALVLWGTRDRFLGRELARPSEALVPNSRVEYFDEGGHWLQHDCPEQVRRALLAFLQPAPVQAS